MAKLDGSETKQHVDHTYFKWSKQKLWYHKCWKRLWGFETKQIIADNFHLNIEWAVSNYYMCLVSAPNKKYIFCMNAWCNKNEIAVIQYTI